MMLLLKPHIFLWEKTNKRNKAQKATLAYETVLASVNRSILN